jgi:hypothetical protein
MRGPKTKVIGGKRYERVGSEPTKDPTKHYRGTTMSLNAWIKFQRDANNLNARVVKIAPGVYEGYVRLKSK